MAFPLSLIPQIYYIQSYNPIGSRQLPLKFTFTLRITVISIFIVAEKFYRRFTYYNVFFMLAYYASWAFFFFWSTFSRFICKKHQIRWLVLRYTVGMGNGGLDGGLCVSKYSNDGLLGLFVYFNS